MTARVTRVTTSVGVRVREGVTRLTQADRVIEVARVVGMVRVSKVFKATKVFLSFQN